MPFVWVRLPRIVSEVFFKDFEKMFIFLNIVVISIFLLPINFKISLTLRLKPYYFNKLYFWSLLQQISMSSFSENVLQLLKKPQIHFFRVRLYLHYRNLSLWQSFMNDVQYTLNCPSILQGIGDICFDGEVKSLIRTVGYPHSNKLFPNLRVTKFITI